MTNPVSDHSSWAALDPRSKAQMLLDEKRIEADRIRGAVYIVITLMHSVTALLVALIVS